MDTIEMAFILRLPLILILSAVIHCSTDEDSCPNGAQIDQDHFHCYWMPASALTWPEAKDVCQKIKDGDLAFVDKPGLQKFLNNAFQLEISTLVWIRNGNETGLDQHSGFGSARSSPEDLKHAACSTMILGLGQWLNSTCDQKHRFICGRQIPVSLPLLDSYVIGVPLMSARFTQSQLQPLPSLPDVQQKVEMMMFPGLWFSHGGRVLSVDLVTQPSQQLTMAKVQILRPYCSPNYHLVPPGCSSLLNPFSCCSQKPLCNTTGGCPTGQYWCHLLESCLSVTSPCSPYHLFPGGHVFTLPPRYPALAPFYHVVTDIALEIPSASEPVHLTVPLKEKKILVYPDDIVAVQHTRNSEEFLHCVSSSDSGWRQSYLSLSGPEWGGWVDAILSAQADRTQWVDGVVCDLRLIHQDNVNVFDVSPQTEIYNIAVTTSSTTLSKASTPVSGMQLVYPVLSKENKIHLPVNIQTPIILKILSGRNAMSTWSAPVSKTEVPFLPSCPAEVPDIQRVCERVTDDTWYSYVYFMPTSQGEQSLNITTSNKLNSQTISVKVQSHIIITGLSVQPQGFYRVLVDIQQMFTALVASGSSVKYTWLIDNPFQFAHTGETYSILFRKPGKYIIKVKAENPVSSQIFELKLEADAMIPLTDLTLFAEPEAIAVNTLNIYNLKVKLDVSIGVKIRWDFGDGSVCVSHTVPAPLDRNDNSMDQTATQVYLKDSAHHTYTTPGDYSLSIQVQNEYDLIQKAALIKVRVPLTKLLVSLVPTVPKVNQNILLEASTLPSSYGVHYTWRFGDGTLEVKGPHNSISHTFKEAGVYNVSVCSNNTLSKLVTWMEVEVFETISGLHVWNNGPNELNTVTEITGRVATGTSLSWTFELGDGTVFTELSKSLILHTYKSTGNFTVQVTVSNAVSRVTQLINIEIYQLAIIGILPSDCITSGKEINLQALVKGNVSELTFHWWFGNGTATSIKKGMSTIVHTFSDSGNYSTDVTIYSQTGSASYQTSVCVEALITDLNLQSASNVVAIGEKICFDVSVIPAGGETYQFLWYISSFSDPPVNGVSQKCFVFSEEGTQEVVVIVQNRVSQKTAKLTIFVQRPVTNLYIRHSGNLNVFTYNQTYYFWTEPSQSNVIVEWDFGDGSAKKEGRNISHVFTSAGQYHVTSLVFNAVSKEVVSVQVEVQVPISSLVIQTMPFAEAGQDTLITATSNVINDLQFYWKVNSDAPSQLGTSQYKYVFPKAGIFEVSVTAHNLVSEMNASTLIEVVERIQGVQITSQSLKSLRYFPTNETVTLTASVEHGTRLTYQWLAQQHGVKTTTEDGKHFKLLTCISGDVFVKLTVANVLGEVQSDVSLRAVERISAVNISSPVNVISKGQPVNISLYLPTGSDLEYIWFSDLDRTPVTSDVPYLSHVFNTVGIFNLSVSVQNIFSSAHTAIQLTVQEPVSEIDFKVDGKSNPFIVPSNQLLQFQGSAQTGTVQYWKWILDVQEGNDIVIGKNQAVSYSFLDEGDYRVTIAASNDVSWQVVSHIVTVQNVIKGLSLRVSHSVICENEPITFKPSISQGSGVTFLLEFPEGNTSLKVQEEFTTSFLPVGNHTVKVVARNHVSIISATVSVQVVERIRSLHLINCCPEVLEASKLTNFRASVDTTSQVTYQWSFFQDGFNTSHQVGQSVNYTPISNGSLSVTVNASTNVCSQSLTKTVFVQWPVKNIKLVVSSAELFVDHPITFVVLTDNCCDLTYKWEFGDSKKIWLTKSNQANHTYSIEGKFIMQVTVINNISKISEWFPIVVKKLQCLQPQVSLIQDQPHLQIFKSRPNYFEARVNLNGCTFYKTKYLWKIFHDLNCTERKVSLKGLVDLTMPLLSLPKHSLEVGDYCLKFTTRFHGTPLQHNKTTTFSVVNSPLVPLIKGGSYRLWSSRKDLILDGTESYDPDATVQEKEPLKFQWNISLQNTTASWSSQSLLSDRSVQWNNSRLVLSKEVLKPTEVYHFILTVHKDGRPPVSTKQIIKVYDTEVLPVTVKCVSCSLLTSFYISHSHPVALAGWCLHCNGTVQYKWTTVNNRGTVLHLNEITTSTGDHSPDLVIRPDVLTPGSEYIFTLNVFQPTTGLWGSASITVTTSYPPQGGTCTQSPNDSVQLLQDKVSFNCTGWVDKDNQSAQMIYSLQVEQCEPSGPRCPLTVLYRGTQNTFSSLVPLGIARKEFNASIITVIVMVEDNMGAKVTALRRNLVVKLSLNNQNTTAWLKKRSQSELWALLQQGNPQDVVQYSTALISHLNQLKDISMHEWKDKVQMRGNVTQVLASFTVSSLQDAAQISFALAQSTAVPSEVQCGHCHIQVVESMKKMIKVIREQTSQGDVTPTDTGRNILNVLGSSMAAVQKPINSSGLHSFYQNHSTSVAAASAFHQVGELMRALMWSRMPGEEALSLKTPQISVVGKRGNPTSDLLCTEQSRQCQFHISSALTSQLRTVKEDVLQILLVIEDEKNPFILAADPPISTTLAAMEFATPQGQPIPIANLTTESAIRVTLHKRKMEGSCGVNVTLPSEGSLNFTIRAVETDQHAGLFIAFTFNWIQGFGESISGKVSITVADHQDLSLSQHSLVQELTLSVSADIPSTEETVYLTPLLNGSVKDLYVSMNSSVNVKLEVSVCVFSSLCQFFNMEERRWSTAGLSVLSSSRRNTAHCLSEHLTLFGASLFVYPDAVLLLPPSDGPVRNVVVGIVCGVLLLIHVLLGLIAHKLDHLEGLRLSCVSLCGQPGRYQYRVLVKTGWQRGAGTSAHVGISLYGLNKSGSRHLQREGAFQRNGLDDFHIETEANLGEIWKICIWHDNTGLDPSWYLQHVSVWDMQTDNIFFFIVEDWLSVENEKNCGMVQKVVLATCPQELQQFGKILCAQLVFGLREHHLWFSLWERPAHSHFSRAQRVTCCALILHLYLAAGAVWYGAVGTRNSRGAVADQMLMNAETILAGMTMAVLMFPFQSFLTFLFRSTKNKVDMELSLPPSPMSDTVEMDIYLNHQDISCSSFLSMPRYPESFSDEASSSLTESLDSPKLESEFWDTLNIGFESPFSSKVGQWASTDSIFESFPEITGPTRLLKRKRALLQLRLTTPESGPPTHEPSASSYLKEKPFLPTDEELRPVSTDPYTSSAASTGPSTSDSGRYSPNEAFLFGSWENSSSEWMDLIEDKHGSECGLYKSQSLLSVASLASTFLPSLPPDSFSTTSITRIGVPRREPGPMLPSWVLAVVYLHVVLLMGTCMALVGLYGSTFSSSVVLMWLISAFSAFLTSVLVLEPFMISIRALYLAAIVKPVDPEVEDRLAQETVVKRTEGEMGDKVRPLCGYSLLQAREEARKVRKLQKLMKNCLIAMLFFLVVLMVNYQGNIQEMNGRLLLPAVKHSIISTTPGKPDLTALSGWMGAWQWMYQSLTSHLHKNPSLTLLGLPRLQRTQSKNFCGENKKNPVKIGHSLMMNAPGLPSLKETHPSNSTSFFLFWPWNDGQSCVFIETEEVLLGNSTGSTSNILSSLQEAHWITPETQSLLVEFTQYHRETGLFLPISILLKNTETQMLQSSIFIQTFHTPGSDVQLDLNVTLTALLLLFSLCFLSAEILTIVREKVQYFIQAQHLFQLILAVISFMAASLRLYYFSLATSCLSSHITQPDTFTDFHSPAVLFRTSSQLSALLLMLLVLQMIGSVRFVRRWAVFGKVLQQMSPVLCGAAVLFLLLLLLFSHTGSLLFSGSVEGFVTVEKSLQSLLCLLRGRMVLHQLCKQHPVLGPLFCLSAFGLCFWLLSRICGAVLLQTYRTVRGEIYHPSMEPQDYEMVECLIKRLKLWMGLSKTKEFRHRVKFEGMEPPPSRSSQCSRFSSSPTPVSPAAPRLVSSTSSLASESSVLSDSHEVQQYVDRLPPSVDNLLAGFDRVNQLTEDVYNIELQLQNVYSRIIQKRKTQREAQPKTSKKCSVSPELPDPKRQSQTSLTMGTPQVHPLRRAIHSESYILGSSTIPPTLSVVTKNLKSQIANPEIKNFPRRRAWHSGSCHSADTIQRCAKPQTPEDIPVRPRSEEGDLGKVSRRMPVKRRAWHPETSELENNSEESAL